MEVIRLPEIQSGFAGPKAVFTYASVFMQCSISSNISGPNRMVPDMSFSPMYFRESLESHAHPGTYD